jgi:hypothetical protein
MVKRRDVHTGRYETTIVRPLAEAVKVRDSVTSGGYDCQRLPSRMKVSIGPFPLMSTVPCGSTRKRSLTYR